MDERGWDGIGTEFMGECPIPRDEKSGAARRRCRKAVCIARSAIDQVFMPSMVGGILVILMVGWAVELLRDECRCLWEVNEEWPVPYVMQLAVMPRAGHGPMLVMRCERVRW